MFIQINNQVLPTSWYSEQQVSQTVLMLLFVFDGSQAFSALFWHCVTSVLPTETRHSLAISEGCTQVVLEFLPGQTIVRWVTAVDAMAAAAEAAISGA